MWNSRILVLAALCGLPLRAAVAPIRVAKDGSGDFPAVPNAVDHVMDRVLTPFARRTSRSRTRTGWGRRRWRFPCTRTARCSGAAAFSGCRTGCARRAGQFYVDCYIAGHVEFIFGNADAVFERCEIRSRGAGHLAAVCRAMPAGPGGFVFDHCKLTADPGVQSVALGRPWRLYARVVFLNCWAGEHIRPEGWNNWGKPEAEKTAYFAEFGSEGPGPKEAERVKWAHSLASSEAEKFRAGVFLRGDDGWKPASVSGNVPSPGFGFYDTSSAPAVKVRGSDSRWFNRCSRKQSKASARDRRASRTTTSRAADMAASLRMVASCRRAKARRWRLSASRIRSIRRRHSLQASESISG